jgi:hypothetical protein
MNAFWSQALVYLSQTKVELKSHREQVSSGPFNRFLYALKAPESKMQYPKQQGFSQHYMHRRLNSKIKAL